jgi:hypothetical protein
MPDKAFIKEMAFGVFLESMDIVAQVDYCRVGETIPTVVNSGEVSLNASPNQIQVALTAATIAFGATIGFNLTNDDIYILDLVKGVP